MISPYVMGIQCNAPIVLQFAITLEFCSAGFHSKNLEEPGMFILSLSNLVCRDALVINHKFVSEGG